MRSVDGNPARDGQRVRGRQRGVAIVLALSVVALAALAATAMLVAQSTWSRQVELTAGHAQAQHLLQAGLDWSRAVLSDDYRASEVDHLGEPWALRLPSMPVENGSLAGHVEDEQGKINLNNLLKDGTVNAAQLEHFRRLLAILALPPALADSLADWVDADGQVQPRGGAEDAHYLALPAPHLAANRPLTDIAELALVAGFDDRARARLRPFVTALPRFAAININTASPEVIAATVAGLSLDDARGIVAQRERTWFRDISEFTRQLPTGLSVPSETIAVSSDYFVATMSITIGGAQARGSALLAREHGGWPVVVWRKFP